MVEVLVCVYIQYIWHCLADSAYCLSLEAVSGLGTAVIVLVLLYSECRVLALHSESIQVNLTGHCRIPMHSFTHIASSRHVA